MSRRDKMIKIVYTQVYMKTNVLVIVVVGIIALGLVVWGIAKLSTTSSIPGKYDEFAQCLKDGGVKFYGAFWCPHCQAQKKLFEKSAKLLPYVECSNNDMSQTQICKENNIEGYPTWSYPKPITVTSDNDPVVCQVQPGPADQPNICATNGSTFYKVWFFSDLEVLSGTDPTHTGSEWIFPAGSHTSGEMSFENLAKFSGCALPQ